jgi:hypothetical protein
MNWTRLAALALIVLVPGAAHAQEKIANPEFAQWSKFKKGTSVTLKTVSEAAGMKSEMTMTMTLVEVGADKVVVASSSVVKAAGMEFKSPPMNRDVPKLFELPKGVKKEELEGQATKVEGKYEEGTETLKVAGVEVKTKWFKYKHEAEGIKSEGRMWMSEDVPGWLVKSEASTSGAVASTMKTELVEFKKP